MAKIDGGTMVARALASEGVRCLFTLSGGHIDLIYNACAKLGIGLVDTRHEQSAVHAAEGWARATGQPGVALVTAGPGVTNAVTAIVNAWVSASPLVVLAGRSPLRDFEVGGLQDIDHVCLVQAYTKWARTCLEARRIPEYVSIAFRHACTGRPGPVFLDIPADVLYEEADETELVFPERYRTTARLSGDSRLVSEAVAMLARAERPVVHAGSGVWWSGAAEELRELVSVMQVPVVTSNRAQGAVPDDDPLCSSGLGMRLVSDADAVLAMAARHLSSERLAAKVAQVDIDAREIGHNQPVDIGIVGDAKAVLRQLVDEAKRTGAKANSAWAREFSARKRKADEALEPLWHSDAAPIHPLRLARELRDFLAPDAFWVVDGGDTSIYAAQTFRTSFAGHNLSGGPLGCLGVGMGFAMAAKLAHPDKQVLLFSGDGSFGFAGIEFHTAVRHCLPVVCVINNDCAWGMIKHGQEIKYGSEAVLCSDLGLVRYDQMVEALGGHGEFVERPEDIRPALEQAFASGEPACVNVATDPNAVSLGSVWLAQMLHP